MSGTVAELKASLGGVVDDRAKEIAYLWDRWHQQRLNKIAEWEEVRNYIFATDTSKTTNGMLPWKNSTATPKICQIRDNLHANYISALFPNSNWLKWEGGTFDDDTKAKADAITSYILTKTRYCIGGEVGQFETATLLGMVGTLYHYELSGLRRAKYGTQALLWPSGTRFVS